MLSDEVWQRLFKLSLRFEHLVNYNGPYSDNTNHERYLLGEDISLDLGEAWSVAETSHQVNQELKNNAQIDEAKLARWEQTMERITAQVRAAIPYEELLGAYRANNQRVIGELVPKVFFGIERLEKQRILYHGVIPRQVSQGIVCLDFDEETPTLGNILSPDDYTARVKDILRFGLLPTRPGLHYGLDEQMTPVFTVDDPMDSYGLLFLEMNPLANGYEVFYAGEADGQEHLIYTPRLTLPAKLLLKPAEAIRQGWHNSVQLGSKSEERDFLQYRDDLGHCLREQGIPFQVWEAST